MNRQKFEQAVGQLVDTVKMDDRDQVARAVDQARESLENLFVGYLEFQFAGIEDAGFWSKAWNLFYKYGEDLEDCYQQVLTETVDLVVNEPEVAEQGAGYLLQRATWRAMNEMRRLQNTYIKNARNIQVTSLDVEDRTGRTKRERVSTPMVDVELKVAVRQVVEKLDPKDAEIARLLMDGYQKSEVAELLGVTPAAISYRVRKLRVALEQEHVEVEKEPEVASPEIPPSLRKAWWN